MAEISSLSTMFVLVEVNFTDPVTELPLNPTADAVVMAFTSTNADPLVGDWKTASWRTGGPPYIAQCLVGPASSVVLAKGGYHVWVKVTDSPELPVLQGGFLKVI
jgi:hypothetical protein